MWPWEHVLFAYLAYSLLMRLNRTRPTGAGTVAIVAGALLPDLIDKPLAWEFGILPSGYGVAHSVFVAVSASVLVLLGAAAVSRMDVGIGFAIGYLGHLLGDVVPISLRLGEPYVEHLLWPIQSVETGPAPSSFAAEVRVHLVTYLGEIASLDPSTGLLVQLSLGIVGLVCWLLDGAPGWAPIGRAYRRARGYAST